MILYIALCGCIDDAFKPRLVGTLHYICDNIVYGCVGCINPFVDKQYVTVTSPLPYPFCSLPLQYQLDYCSNNYVFDKLAIRRPRQPTSLDVTLLLEFIHTVWYLCWTTPQCIDILEKLLLGTIADVNSRCIWLDADHVVVHAETLSQMYSNNELIRTSTAVLLSSTGVLSSLDMRCIECANKAVLLSPAVDKLLRTSIVSPLHRELIRVYDSACLGPYSEYALNSFLKLGSLFDRRCLVTGSQSSLILDISPKTMPLLDVYVSAVLNVSSLIPELQHSILVPALTGMLVHPVILDNVLGLTLRDGVVVRTTKLDNTHVWTESFLMTWPAYQSVILSLLGGGPVQLSGIDKRTMTVQSLALVTSSVVAVLLELGHLQYGSKLQESVYLLFNNILIALFTALLRTPGTAAMLCALSDVLILSSCSATSCTQITCSCDVMFGSITLALTDVLHPEIMSVNDAVALLQTPFHADFSDMCTSSLFAVLKLADWKQGDKAINTIRITTCTDLLAISDTILRAFASEVSMRGRYPSNKTDLTRVMTVLEELSVWNHRVRVRPFNKHAKGDPIMPADSAVAAVYDAVIECLLCNNSDVIHKCYVVLKRMSRVLHDAPATVVDVVGECQ